MGRAPPSRPATAADEKVESAVLRGQPGSVAPLEASTAYCERLTPPVTSDGCPDPVTSAAGGVAYSAGWDPKSPNWSGRALDQRSEPSGPNSSIAPVPIPRDAGGPAVTSPASTTTSSSAPEPGTTVGDESTADPVDAGQPGTTDPSDRCSANTWPVSRDPTTMLGPLSSSVARLGEDWKTCPERNDAHLHDTTSPSPTTVGVDGHPEGNASASSAGRRLVVSTATAARTTTPAIDVMTTRRRVRTRARVDIEWRPDLIDGDYAGGEGPQAGWL